MEIRSLFKHSGENCISLLHKIQSQSPRYPEYLSQCDCDKVYFCDIKDDELSFPSKPIVCNSWDNLWEVIISQGENQILGENSVEFFNNMHIVEKESLSTDNNHCLKSLYECLMTYEYRDEVPEEKIMHNLFKVGFQDYVIEAFKTFNEDTIVDERLIKNNEWNDEKLSYHKDLFLASVYWANYVDDENGQMRLNLDQGGQDVIDRLSNFENDIILDYYRKKIFQGIIRWDIEYNKSLRDRFINVVQRCPRILEHASKLQHRIKSIKYIPFNSITQFREILGLSEEDSYRYNVETPQKREEEWDLLCKNIVFTDQWKDNTIKPDLKTVIVVHNTEQIPDKLKDCVWDTFYVERLLNQRPSYEVISRDSRSVKALFHQQLYQISESLETYEGIKHSLPQTITKIIDEKRVLLFSGENALSRHKRDKHDRFFPVIESDSLTNFVQKAPDAQLLVIAPSRKQESLKWEIAVLDNDKLLHDFKDDENPVKKRLYLLAEHRKKNNYPLQFNHLSEHERREIGDNGLKKYIKESKAVFRTPDDEDLDNLLKQGKRLVYVSKDCKEPIEEKVSSDRIQDILIWEHDDFSESSRVFPASDQDIQLLGLKPLSVYKYWFVQKEPNVFSLKRKFSLEKYGYPDNDDVGRDEAEPLRVLKTAAQSFPSITDETLRKMLDWISKTYNIPRKKSGEICWRPTQKEAISTICKYSGGNRNFLTIIPTGGGKSLIFQGPLLYKAMERGSKKLSIVITPLQALMRDQVNGLIDLKPDFKKRVAFIDGNTPIEDQRKVKDLIRKKELSLLYIAPERFLMRSFYEKVIKKAALAQGIDSFIFDEAHCITGWGMDFRPDYIFALRKCRELQHKYPGISILMFTATLPEQAKLDLMEEFKNSDGIVEFEESNVIPAISSEEYDVSLCPIRDHIDLSIQKVDGIDSKSDEGMVFNKKMEIAFDKLFNGSFSPELLLSGKSRALIFTQTRAEAEAASHWLQDKLREDERNSDFADHIDFFHAGIRNPKRKNDILEKYESGEILILFATKAFGLGMNIKNIHFVLHLTPPTYIEDYLQEVGRAARDKELYEKVFTDNKKITAHCLYSPADIEKNKDRIERIEWEDVMTSFARIKDYLSKFSKITANKLFVVPLNLLEQQHSEETGTEEEGYRYREEFEPVRKKDKTVVFQQCLGWLEKKDDGFARIEVGFKCPNAYDMGIGEKFWDKDIEESPLLSRFIEYARSQVSQKDNRVIIKANDIFADESIGVQNLSELESLIDEGVKRRFFTRDYMYVNVSLKKQSKDYIEAFVEKEIPLKVLESLNKLLSRNPSDADVEAVLDEMLNKEYSDEKYSKTKKYIKGVLVGPKKENWNFFKQLNQIYTVDEIVGKCEALLKTIYKAPTDSVTWKSLEESLNAANDPNMIRLFLYAIYKLNYADRGGLCTDFIEIKIIDKEDITNSVNPSSRDYKIKKKFDKFYEVKEMKAGAMCALIEEFKSSDTTKNYIKEYSRVKDDGLDRFEPLKRRSNRMTARQNLNTAVEKNLNKEQRDIYNLSTGININVLAGAGSGKTRLLTYRALRLILAENNPERRILILAYNRAVRDEVEKRMVDYAASIGYTLHNLQIYTFHGFAAKCLPELTDKTANMRINFSEWEKKLLDDIKNHSEKYSNKYQFLLIDEFQDVTQTRLNIILELLKLNNNGIYNAKAFVIGDMFQSIYGYEKRKDWDGTGDRPSIEPIDYYNQFIGFKERKLCDNYRSYQAIIDAAITWFDGLPDAYDKYKKLIPRLNSKVHDDFEDGALAPMEGDWKEDLINTIIPAFLKNREAWFSKTTKNYRKFNPFSSVGILFRSNADVHDAFTFLRKELDKKKYGFDLRIQGSDIYYMDTREFFFFTKFLLDKNNNVIDIYEIKNWQPEDKISVYDDTILEVARNLAVILVSKFKLSTYSELEQRFTDIAFTERDRLREFIERENTDMEQGANPKIVLSTIHKVKGMEYDVVVVPPSTYPIGLDSDNLTPEENNMEERRLMYVAFSRAKRRLYYYMGDREKAINNNLKYEGKEGTYYAKDGLDKIDQGFAALQDDSLSGVHENISKLYADTPLRLIKDNGQWLLKDENDNTIGKLSKGNKLASQLNKAKNNSAKGLFVKAIYVNDDVMTQSRKNELIKENDKFRVWSEAAIQRGYVYYVDYYGCAEPVEE